MSAAEQVLADAREEAAILRRAGHAAQADAVLRLLEAMERALPEYLTWLAEDDAAAYTGRAPEWLRARFPAWEARGLARAEHRRRFYRRCILEHRGNAAAAREAGRRAAGRAA